jgi:hypothetical protein
MMIAAAYEFGNARQLEARSLPPNEDFTSAIFPYESTNTQPINT